MAHLQEIEQSCIDEPFCDVCLEGYSGEDVIIVEEAGDRREFFAYGVDYHVDLPEFSGSNLTDWGCI